VTPAGSAFPLRSAGAGHPACSRCPRRGRPDGAVAARGLQRRRAATVGISTGSGCRATGACFYELTYPR
jgi:hypothetical protein